MEPGNEEYMADRQAVASGEEERQHDENIMRDIHIGKRGSETANKEQADILRTTGRIEQDTPNTESSSSMHVFVECLASGKRQDRPEPVFVQNSGHVDDDMQISALDIFYEMDGRWSRYNKEVLDWYREGTARDPRRNELNHLFEKEPKHRVERRIREEPRDECINREEHFDQCQN